MIFVISSVRFDESWKKKKIFKNDSQNPDNGIASFFFFNCDNLTQFTNNKNINW